MSLFPQMTCSETHRKNIQVNQENFLSLIRNVEKVIILDANVSQAAIDFVRKIRTKQEPQITKFTIAPRRKRRVIFNSPILLKMEESLEQGNNIFITCSRSIKFGTGIIQGLRNKFPHLKYVYINSENKNEHHELLSNTDKWKEYNVVMISPCISTGVSCVVRNHFWEVFCFFTRQTSNPLDSSQQIGRIRHPITENIYVDVEYKSNKFKHGVKTPEQVLHMLYQNIHDIYTSNCEYIDTEFDYDTFERVIKTTPRTDLFIHNYTEQSRLHHLWEYSFRKSLENSYICEYPEIETTLTEKNNNEVIRIKNKEEERKYENERTQSVFVAPNITDEEADKLTQKSRTDLGLTKTELYKYEKWLLTKKTKIPAHGIDLFFSIHENRESRVLYNKLNGDCLNVVRCVSTYLFNRPDLEDKSNWEKLKMIWEPIKFKLNPIMETDTYTTKFMDETLKGKLLGYIRIQEILKLFGGEYFYQQLRLTDEEFKVGFLKFGKWCLENGGKRFFKMCKLFTMEKKQNCFWDIRTFRKEIEVGNSYPYTINRILSSVGMGFRID
ncbi:hypothetical protein EBU94_06470, partial [bacterium]|nr:hypothetical protein [bacterium]